MNPCRTLPAALLLVLALAGCASSTTPVPPCCYAGEVETLRLAELPVTLADGRTLSFAEVFAGYAPQQGVFARALPFDEVLPEDVVFASLLPLLPLYDANGDGRLEKPEVVVLYAREAARATGVDVAHFGAGEPVWAVSAPSADIGGLVAWVEANRSRMSPQGQTIFRDLENLGRDLRVRGSEGGDGDDDAIIR